MITAQASEHGVGGGPARLDGAADALRRQRVEGRRRVADRHPGVAGDRLQKSAGGGSDPWLRAEPEPLQPAVGVRGLGQQ